LSKHYKKFIYIWSLTRGALRLQLARGGTPASRTFIIVSTIATDAAAKFVNNTIIDPAFVRSHIENWSAIWKNGNEGRVASRSKIRYRNT
jgi:hypothetical protein